MSEAGSSTPVFDASNRIFIPSNGELTPKLGPTSSHAHPSYQSELPTPPTHSEARKNTCVNFDTVYLLRDRCSCLPRWLLNCCFRKAKITNAFLDVDNLGKDANVADESFEISGDENFSDSDLSASEDESDSESENDEQRSLLVNDSPCLGSESSYAPSPVLSSSSYLLSPQLSSPGYGTISTDSKASLKKSKRRKKKRDAKESAFRPFKLIGLCAATACVGVFNNFTFVKMGHAMGYPAFLLYFTTLIYVLVYVSWFIYNRYSYQRTKDLEVQTYLAKKKQLLAQKSETEAEIYSNSLKNTSMSTPFSKSPKSTADFSRGLAPLEALSLLDMSVNSQPGLKELAHESDKNVDFDVDSSVFLSKINQKLQKMEAKSPTPLPTWYDGLFNSKIGLYYLAIGVLITVGGGCSQFADPHVSGGVQAALNQLTLPLTAIFARWWLKHRFTFVEIVGACVVFIASLLPLLPLFLTQSSVGLIVADIIGFDAKNHHFSAIATVSEDPSVKSVVSASLNSPFWVFIFFLSDFPSAMVNVIEEIVFSKPYSVDEVHNLAFTNLITLVGYFSMIPLDAVNPDRPAELIEQGVGSWEMQKLAFQCFFHGSSEIDLPPGCLPNAWLPVIGFVACIVVYFYVSAVVVKTESASFQAISSALVTPLSTLAFSSKFLMGAHATPVDEVTILAILFIPMGIVIYKWDDISGNNTEEDIIPLIARH